MRSPAETRCAGVADMCMKRLYQKESRGESRSEILRGGVGENDDRSLARFRLRKWVAFLVPRNVKLGFGGAGPRSGKGRCMGLLGDCWKGDQKAHPDDLSHQNLSEPRHWNG